MKENQQQTSTASGDDAHTPEQDAIAIERASPEGRPGDPGMRTCGISALILAIVAALLIAAIVIAIVIDWRIGLAVGAFGIVLLIFNPLLLVSQQRAAEREEATHDSDANP